MPKDDEQRRLADERLSALADGELDAAALAQVCADWRDDGESRAAWHSYQLIGDVLRSGDLASNAARDAAFLVAFRARLAAEPVVLAPSREDAEALEVAHVARVASFGRGRSARWTWRSSSAVAAGFVVVAGALVMTRSNEPRQDLQVVASIARPAPASVAPVARDASEVVVAQPAQVNEPQTLVANGQVIRDARLDRYLAAHKQFAGTSALGIPSAYLRSATAESRDR
jgi:sigma-E factor negative regulatory protein RseA